MTATVGPYTWFGGYVGAVGGGVGHGKPRSLHLLTDNGDAFCGARGLHAPTARQVDAARWCEECHAAAQAARRDLP